VVRAGTCRVLKNMGYRVASAADGLEALERFQAAEPRFDLVLLDLACRAWTAWPASRSSSGGAPEARVVVTTATPWTAPPSGARGGGLGLPAEALRAAGDVRGDPQGLARA
jgi:DNA-binding NarL/FixJ family response regulator